MLTYKEFKAKLDEATIPEIPKEVEVWNNMNPEQKAEIMAKVGHQGSIKKTYKACLAHIKKHMG